MDIGSCDTCILITTSCAKMCQSITLAYHKTITCVARFLGGRFRPDLVLNPRCNALHTPHQSSVTVFRSQMTQNRGKTQEFSNLFVAPPFSRLAGACTSTKKTLKMVVELLQVHKFDILTDGVPPTQSGRAEGIVSS